MKRILISIIAILILLTSCSAHKTSTEITSLDDLREGKRKIGVASTTNEHELVAKEFPNAEILYYSDDMGAYASVARGKIDAFVFDRESMEVAIHNGLKGTRILDEAIGEEHISGAAFSPVTKIPDLENKVNTFLAEVKADGTLEDMARRWIYEGNDQMPDIELPETSDIHLVVGTTGANMPFTYYVGPNLVGYDIELAYRFAAWLGTTMEFKVYDYAGIIPATQTGDVDVIFANLFKTPERAEALKFSDPTHIGSIGVMVRDGSVAIPELQDFDELAGKRVSMLTGAPFEELVRSKAPDVGEFTFFNNNPDMILALKSDKTDAVLTNNAIAALAVNRNPELAFFPESLQDGVFGFAFRKGAAERDKWQEAYDSIPEETKNNLWLKWTGSNEDAKVLPEQDWPGKNGTIKAAVCDTLEPMSYMRDDGQLVGFDLEMILTMAKALDVHVEFTGMEFSAILSSVQAEKADIGAGSIIATDERKESVDFVEYYPASFELVVRGVKAQGGGADASGDSGTDGFFAGVRESFEKTFIREDRWKLFLQGIVTTLIITVASIVFGTILGFFVFMMGRKGNPVANAITKFMVWLVQGMPVVVLLMILYYIVFGHLSIPGAVVSIIAFTLVFGSGVYSLIKAGVGTIDIGQTEAAYALGYPDKKAFYKVILPQALPHFMPAYKGEITALIKATAIVGYVAVQDLTKMADIVRSRTYDAFFPLIAVAIIYFALAGFLKFIVGRIERRIDPRRRNKNEILKGIDTHGRINTSGNRN